MPAGPDKMLQPLGGGRVIGRAALPPDNKAPPVPNAPKGRATLADDAMMRRTSRLVMVQSEGSPMLCRSFGMQAPCGKHALGVPESLRRRALPSLFCAWMEWRGNPEAGGRNGRISGNRGGDHFGGSAWHWGAMAEKTGHHAQP